MWASSEVATLFAGSREVTLEPSRTTVQGQAMGGHRFRPFLERSWWALLTLLTGDACSRRRGEIGGFN